MRNGEQLKSYKHLPPHLQWQLWARSQIIKAGLVVTAIGLVWLAKELVGG